MKKGLVLFLMIVLCLTGCGSGDKQLKCVRDYDGKAKVTYDFRFNNDNVIETLIFIQEIFLEDNYSKEELREIEETACADVKDVKDIISCNVKMTKTTATRTIKINLNERIDELKDYGIEIYDIDTIIYEDLRKEFEDDGYTCK